jgi:hypothetical protein
MIDGSSIQMKGFDQGGGGQFLVFPYWILSNFLRREHNEIIIQYLPPPSVYYIGLRYVIKLIIFFHSVHFSCVTSLSASDVSENGIEPRR